MHNIKNNDFKSIFLPVSIHFREETNTVGHTFIFTLFILSSHFSAYI